MIDINPFERKNNTEECKMKIFRELFKTKKRVIIIISVIVFLMIIGRVDYSNNNEQNEEKVVKSITTSTSKSSVKPTIKEAIFVELEDEDELENDYKIYAISILLKMTDCFNNITLYCNNLNVVGVKGEIDKLTEIKNELNKKETPKKYNNFRDKIIKAIEHWEIAYDYMVIGDTTNTSYHTNQAIILLREVSEEYKGL